jgi:hypothetical protein
MNLMLIKYRINELLFSGIGFSPVALLGSWLVLDGRGTFCNAIFCAPSLPDDESANQ